MDPKDGLAYLIDNDLVADTAESICNFLSAAEGLSKRRLGEYFGRVRGEEDNRLTHRMDRGTRGRFCCEIFLVFVLFRVLAFVSTKNVGLVPHIFAEGK